MYRLNIVNICTNIFQTNYPKQFKIKHYKVNTPHRISAVVNCHFVPEHHIGPLYPQWFVSLFPCFFTAMRQINLRTKRSRNIRRVLVWTVTGTVKTSWRRHDYAIMLFKMTLLDMKGGAAIVTIMLQQIHCLFLCHRIKAVNKPMTSQVCKYNTVASIILTWVQMTCGSSSDCRGKTQ